MVKSDEMRLKKCDSIKITITKDWEHVRLSLLISLTHTHARDGRKKKLQQEIKGKIHENIKEYSFT